MRSTGSTPRLACEPSMAAGTRCLSSAHDGPPSGAASWSCAWASGSPGCSSPSRAVRPHERHRQLHQARADHLPSRGPLQRRRLPERAPPRAPPAAGVPRQGRGQGVGGPPTPPARPARAWLLLRRGAARQLPGRQLRRPRPLQRAAPRDLGAPGARSLPGAGLPGRRRRPGRVGGGRGRGGRVSELLDVRVIGAPEVAETAVARVGALLDLDRLPGPYPSRKTQGLARYYLTGRLRQAAPPALPGELERLKREVAALRAALELLTTCQHGHGLDCPRCEPVPDLVRQALAGEAVRPA